MYVCPTSTAPVSGCATNNGGCQIFCFSVPDVNGNGTRVQCGCPTGIAINPDNRSCNQCKYSVLSDSVPYFLNVVTLFAVSIVLEYALKLQLLF